MEMFKTLSFFVLVLFMQNMFAVLPAQHEQEELPTILNVNRRYRERQRLAAQREREAAEQRARQDAGARAIAGVSSQGPSAPQQR